MNPSSGDRLRKSRTTLPLIIVVLVLIGLAGLAFFDGDQSTPSQSVVSDTDGSGKPVSVTPIPKTDLSRVTLTEQAAARLGIMTEVVRDVSTVPAGSAGRITIPYGAVLYDADGSTWTYTNPEPLVYIRHPVSIDYIEQDTAVLTDGPPVGTTVVTAGAAELYGAEFGIGK